MALFNLSNQLLHNPLHIEAYIEPLELSVVIGNHIVCAGYGKTVSHVVIGLKTAKGTKQLKLDPSIYESLQKEKVEVGDVIYIEANSGAVKVLISVTVHYRYLAVTYPAMTHERHSVFHEFEIW